ncbi:ParB N-terminal domain-containing protein [Zunongwangia profunda]|uniref:ParB N-terminal domain-containing protein n=1 Tax=Zunongwangia profunda TaxID=398743 RepID=UPI0005A26003|nr:ParB N-terminal domain-containing protein [Zunongwangia profunda]|tara:strand:- start:51 stop:287 length:237 start_codon:yes stop_codon:yes gene_type:complete
MDKVADISSRMKNNDIWLMNEPIHTYVHNGKTYILDGHHRIEAAKLINKSIDAIEITFKRAKELYGDLINQIHRGFFD